MGSKQSEQGFGVNCVRLKMYKDCSEIMLALPQASTLVASNSGIVRHSEMNGGKKSGLFLVESVRSPAILLLVESRYITKHSCCPL